MGWVWAAFSLPKAVFTSQAARVWQRVKQTGVRQLGVLRVKPPCLGTNWSKTLNPEPEAQPKAVLTAVRTALPQALTRLT